MAVHRHQSRKNPSFTKPTCQKIWLYRCGMQQRCRNDTLIQDAARECQLGRLSPTPLHQLAYVDNYCLRPRTRRAPWTISDLPESSHTISLAIGLLSVFVGLLGAPEQSSSDEASDLHESRVKTRKTLRWLRSILHACGMFARTRRTHDILWVLRMNLVDEKLSEWYSMGLGLY